MRTINTIALSASTAATLAAVTNYTATAGDLHSADFILALENDQIVTGAVDLGSGGIVFPARVKSALLGAEGFPNFTNDPGFNAQLGSLEPGMLIGFSILSALPPAPLISTTTDRSTSSISARSSAHTPARTPPPISTVTAYSTSSTSARSYRCSPRDAPDQTPLKHKSITRIWISIGDRA